jgi:predicted transcriptional regulator
MSSDEDVVIISEQIKLTQTQKEAIDAMRTFDKSTFQEVLNELIQTGFEEHEKIQETRNKFNNCAWPIS